MVSCMLTHGVVRLNIEVQHKLPCKQKCLKTVSTEMEAPADRSVTKELMTDTNVTVLKISDRSAGVSGVAHRSVTV